MTKLEWIPMESNPDAVNSFLRSVGVKKHLKVVDVLGFDEELLQMVVGKVEGLLLLYPLVGETSNEVDNDAKKKLWFMRQTIRNACATMAIIHLLANQCNEQDFEDNSAVLEFIKESKDLEPETKAHRFEECQTIATAHESATSEGQTEAPAANESVEYHFISIIYRDHQIYEMDGRKDGPINHGSTTPGTFLRDGVQVCKKFINLDPTNLNFSVLAFVRDT